MSKTSKKSINYGLKILTVLAFALIFVPVNKAAAFSPTPTPTYVSGHYNADGSYTFGDFVWGYNNNTATNYNTSIDGNPIPAVSSIIPKSGNTTDLNNKTVTVFGSGFIPSSVARINGVNRPITFIDGSTIQVQITANDLINYRSNGGFFVNVFNEGPGGGYSNSAFFAVNDQNASANTNQTNNSGTNNPHDFTGLTSNAIFGDSNSFLPTGFVQWILLAIIILIIVILARKIFGGEKEYHESPMKHA